MIHLFWALLNVGLFLFFLVLCFQATKLIRAEKGLWASLLFAFGLLSLVGHSGSKGNAPNQTNGMVQQLHFTPKTDIIPTTMKHTYVVLEEDIISKIELGVLYGQEKTSNKMAVYDAFSSRQGFASGFQWTPLTISAYPSRAKNIYVVVGTLDWKLLGLTVYTAPKTYSGELTLN